eukprot:TRINITY_DN6296_c0_g2_i1.p1 TRINITY_DN6296_c0_g2~~TRINITY_DN6296_c0_g2_i1.p1  ORF type:complete len:195 (+),score=28.90 TRINITY_DN6296_c0_g2_i1:62-646(+)
MSVLFVLNLAHKNPTAARSLSIPRQWITWNLICSLFELRSDSLVCREGDIPIEIDDVVAGRTYQVVGEPLEMATEEEGDEKEVLEKPSVNKRKSPDSPDLASDQSHTTARRSQVLPGAGTVAESILKVIKTKPMHVTELLRLLEDSNLPRPVGSTEKSRLSSVNTFCARLVERGLLKKDGPSSYSSSSSHRTTS